MLEEIGKPFRVGLKREINYFASCPICWKHNGVRLDEVTGAELQEFRTTCGHFSGFERNGAVVKLQFTQPRTCEEGALGITASSH